jgi:hypothetical protein
VPRQLRRLVERLGQLLHNLRRRWPDSDFHTVDGSGVRRRFLHHDVRRGARWHAVSGLQHGALPWELRWRVGQLGHLLVDLRRR